jgi:hypothetical protein
MNIKNQYNFQKYFLLEFTKNILENTTASEVVNLRRVLNEKEKFFKKPSEEAEKVVIHDIIRARERELTIIKEQSRKSIPQFKEMISERSVRKSFPQKNFLRIPEPKLPQNLSYLKPTPVELEIDLGNLNPFLKDPAIDIVECHGADQEIIVKGKMGTKPTELKLSEDEIGKIISTFSQESKIPTSEGIYKVAVGKFTLSAIISPVLGSKFIISRIVQPAQNIMPRPMKF